MYYCLKAARRDAIANLKWFLVPRDTSDLISIVSLTFTMRCHAIRPVFAPFTSSPWQTLVGFHLPCGMSGNEAGPKIYGGYVKTSVPF